MIFKADSFTVYKLNISHLCDGACAEECNLVVPPEAVTSPQWA
jgi:hypothetical protein